MDWFDTSWYHLLYQNRNYAEAQRFIDNIVDYLGAQSGDLFMDLACGKGRHSIYLAEKGFHVTGLDLSQESIQAAKRQENAHLQFSVHDMREKYVAQKFDYVLNLFTSFGYFETDEEHLDVLLNMKNALRNERSLLVLDFLNAPKVIKGLRPKEIIERENTVFKISRTVESGYVHKKIVVWEDEKEYVFSERVRLYTLDDFVELFAKAGLVVVDAFGDYDLNGYGFDGERLILVGRVEGVES